MVPDKVCNGIGHPYDPYFKNCCSSSEKCCINQGDCGSDKECSGALVCGKHNCPSPFPPHADCCENPGPGNFPLLLNSFRTWTNVKTYFNKSKGWCKKKFQTFIKINITAFRGYKWILYWLVKLISEFLAVHKAIKTLFIGFANSTLHFDIFFLTKLMILKKLILH